MKTLSEYILEARKLIGKPPFSLDELETLLLYMYDYEENEFTEDILGRIGEKWGSSARSFFRGWLESQAWKLDPEKLYKEIQKIPIERLERILGAGSYGTAISVDKDKVIKWFHDGYELDNGYFDNDPRFYEYCLNNKSKVFPRVYRLTNRYVLMEKLKTNTRKAKIYSQLDREDWGEKYNILADGWKKREHHISALDIARYIAKNTDVLRPHFDNIDMDKFTSSLSNQDREFFDWLVQACKEAKIGGFPIGDLKSANIGERSNGDVVWFDV